VDPEHHTRLPSTEKTQRQHPAQASTIVALRVQPDGNMQIAITSAIVLA
jgi:hypothetical protein